MGVGRSEISSYIVPGCIGRLCHPFVSQDDCKSSSVQQVDVNVQSSYEKFKDKVLEGKTAGTYVRYLQRDVGTLVSGYKNNSSPIKVLFC